jgi:hypothetical protein
MRLLDFFKKKTTRTIHKPQNETVRTFVSNEGGNLTWLTNPRVTRTAAARAAIIP